MKTWLKKWWKPLVLVLVLAGFLLYPSVILTEMRVDFEKEDYTAGNHCKVFASPTENLGLDSVKNADKKPGEAAFSSGISAGATDRPSNAWTQLITIWMTRFKSGTLPFLLMAFTQESFPEKNFWLHFRPTIRFRCMRRTAALWGFISQAMILSF